MLKEGVDILPITVDMNCVIWEMKLWFMSFVTIIIPRNGALFEDDFVVPWNHGSSSLDQAKNFTEVDDICQFQGGNNARRVQGLISWVKPLREWIKINSVVMLAELWSVFHEFRLACTKSARKLVLKTDNYLWLRISNVCCFGSGKFRWSIFIVKATDADMLANLGFDMGLACHHIMDLLLVILKIILQNLQGLAFPRAVPCVYNVN
ncbi:conserved hypothetical protein [Ricinus communis]|uniref:Uncharacterized protein n=1 Tax=Ricinus communis TaxID=3988 RepID=B9RPJ7_RICCO|nr:conserved hypothetical protein [Ricinus communis]